MFEFCRVGNFALKCPYKESRDSDSEEEFNHKEQRKAYQHDRSENRMKFLKQRKSLYSKEDNNSSKEDDDDKSSREVLFMAIIEDEDSKEKDNRCYVIKKESSDEETHESQPKTLSEYFYNGTYISASKYDA